MQVGFSIVSRREHVEFHTFAPPGAGRCPLVTVAQENGLVVALMGRLYYRTDLLAGIDAQPPAADDLSDADLALAAYRAQGLAGLERLEGDFALVVWDAAQGRLLACRDPMGGYPLFWVEHTD